MNTVATTLAAAADTLAAAGIDTARLDAEVLLACAMDLPRAGLLARLRDPIDSPSAGRFAELLRRRRRREPVAHLVGGREFWSLWFEVTRDTLVPRPETEVLVEICLARAAAIARPRILDAGTGSGCIAVDVSDAALAVARRNAERHGVAQRIGFERADIRDFNDTGFDLLVANPPYARRGEIDGLEPEVSRWEPRAALDGGEDGLDLVRQILERSAQLIVPGGAALVEIGCDQSESALELAARAGFAAYSIRADYAGLPRVLVAERCAA